MKVLLSLFYPGYLRYFDSTVRELEARGHEVSLCFEFPHKQEEGLAALEGTGERVRVLGRTPGRKDTWTPAARALRRTADYARYLHPRFADTPLLRRRMEHNLPRGAGFLTRPRSLGARAADALVAALLAGERAIPSAERLERYLRSREDDVVVVSPLVNDSSRQTDLLKAARARGIPSVLAVGSWDHLTTKGLIREQPDAVLVWNEVQRREAVELHRVPPERIVVTGAQPFDRWFERRPSTTREEFCAKVGLPDARPFLLFVGSTASISEPDAEVDFVRRWVEAVRRRAPMSEMSVVVRPHPYNSRQWSPESLAGLEACVLWPRDGANPVDEDDRADYFDSLHHSAAVVGVNTSAMIEAAIAGRPVHTVRTPEFADTQEGTVHFGYLMPEQGGFVQASDGLEEHAERLARSLDDPEPSRELAGRFVASFVRPAGAEVPCTPLVADAIERVAREPAAPPVPSAGGELLASAVWLAATAGTTKGRRLAWQQGAGRIVGPVRRAAAWARLAGEVARANL